MILKKLKEKLRTVRNLTPMNQTETPTESERLAQNLTRCPYTIVKGVEVPITSQNMIPILVATTPASSTTRQRIEATLLASTDQAQADLRFLDFFPPPVPFPQFLQPGFIKYKQTYEPVARARPCVGFRVIEP